MATLRYALRMLGVVVRSPLMVAMTVALLIFASLGLVLPLDSDPGVGTLLNKSSYEASYESMRELLATGYVEKVSATRAELLQRGGRQA